MKKYMTYQFSSVQSLSRVRLFATPWTAARQDSLSITNSQSSLRLTSIESVMPSSHLILCHPLLLLPSIPPSIRVFSNESTLHMRWPKHWSFSFSIIPSKEIPGLISFRMDWLDLLTVRGTLNSLLQHHTSKASILQRSAFFTVQLWHPYMTTGKTTALTRRTLVGKVMSLLLNIPSYLDLNITIREGDGTSVQYPCLENPMDRGAWWAAVCGVAKSQTQLSTHTHSQVRKWQQSGNLLNVTHLVSCRGRIYFYLLPSLHIDRIQYSSENSQI